MSLTAPKKDKWNAGPRVNTVNIAHRLMQVVEEQVTAQPDSKRFTCAHHVTVPRGQPRIGDYMIVLTWCDKDSNNLNSVSHVFDITLLLDLKDTWEQHVLSIIAKKIVEARTKRLMTHDR